MIKNYLRTILRDFRANKTFTAISIFGLAFGIASVIVIFTLINYSENFDKIHSNGDRIYQAFVKVEYKKSGKSISSILSSMVGPALEEEIPEIEKQVTVWGKGERWFSYDEKKIKQNGVQANASIFEIFSFPIIARISDSVFTASGSIAISESFAIKLFGGVEEALGKTIKEIGLYKNSDKYITSVFKDTPENSSLKFDYVYSMKEAKKEQTWINKWGSSMMQVYLLTAKDVDLNLLNEKLKNFISDHSDVDNRSLCLYKYDNVFMEAPDSNFNRKTLNEIMILIALGILIIASINYINISTSRASKRAKEVALRKVNGANRSSLFSRFMGEAFINAFIALLLAVILGEVIMILIDNFVGDGTQFKIPYTDLTFLLKLLLIFITISFISGFYPAVYLSSFSPSITLKGNMHIKNKWFGIRRSLIVFQFVVSTLFVFITAIVYFQMDYVKNKDLGLEIGQIVEFSLPKSIQNHLDVFKEKVSHIPGIESVTFTDFSPTGVYQWTSDPKWDGKSEDLNDGIRILEAMEDFTKTFNAEIIAGRPFNTLSEDKNNCIINEAMAKLMAIDNPVGKQISFWGDEGIIVGVVKNFHIADLKEEVKPLIIRMGSSYTRTAFVKTNTINFSNTISNLESVYSEYEKEYPLDYTFLDEEFLKRHNEINVLSKYAGIFSFISIIISCLGLIGLTALSISQKTKEIGIRKVLGASVQSLVQILTKEVILIALIAGFIALPIGYYIMNKWLNNYAYHVELGIKMGLITVCIIVTLAIITVSFQSIRAALANPVDSLRDE